MGGISSKEQLWISTFFTSEKLLSRAAYCFIMWDLESFFWKQKLIPQFEYCKAGEEASII